MCDAVPGVTEAYLTSLHHFGKDSEPLGCDDKKGVYLVNIGVQAFPERHTHYIVPELEGPTQIEFQLRSWTFKLGGDGICVYLYDAEGRRLKIRIDEKIIRHSKNAIEYPSHISRPYIVPWQYNKYVIVSAGGWWSLYLEEKVDPVFMYKAKGTVSRVKFDSCFEKKPKALKQ